ncbi:MAG: hypothetical protein ACXV49_10150 [Halobacteriota archaeon]
MADRWIARVAWFGTSRKGCNLLQALAGNSQVSKEAEELMSKPFMPLFLAKLMTSVAGGVGWNSQARKNGPKERMYDTPYETY